MSTGNGNVQQSSSNATARKNPIKSLNKLYADKDETGDVCFIIGSSRIVAHRCVLASISSKYKTQFYGSKPDRDDVKITGTTTAAFEKFIEFFYLDEIVLTTEDIEGVLDLAKQSLVDEFVQLCVDFLVEATSLDNVFLSYRLANLYDIDELKTSCELLIKKDTVKAFKSEDFITNCDRDSLVSILKLDQLNCKETEAFDACIEWAKAACKWKNVDPEKAENLRFELGDAVTHIRFGSMSIEDFVVRQKSCERIFSEDELNEIVYLIDQLKGLNFRKFNQTPRTGFRQQRTCLECNRIISCIAENRFVEYNIVSVPSFICDRSIRLEGLVVNCCEYESLNLILLTLNGTTRHLKKCPPSFKHEQHENETTITFDEPINIRCNVSVKIMIDFNKMYMSNRYKLATHVGSDNVNFYFDKSHADIYVTKFLYSLPYKLVNNKR